MRSANDQVSYIGFLPRSAHLLRSILLKASLFILPSDAESPSYAAIEAASQGSNVLVTQLGSMKELLGNYASYIDPTSVKNIENGIMTSLEKNFDKTTMKDYIKSNFSAKISCSALVDAYRSLCNSH
jgi:glycosyltransferase involved in cell wall biosynthesis